MLVRSILLIFLLVPLAGQSQEMKRLSDLLEEAALPYGATRCAGLYNAVGEWSGSNRLEGVQPGLAERTENIRDLMIYAGIILSQEVSGGSLEAHADNVARDARNISDLYLSRFEKNYAVSGHAFGEDELVQSDLSTCKLIVEKLSPHLK